MKKKDIAAARCLPLPLLLPATADIGALTTAVGRATGAKASDAGVLARVVSVLRRSGGEASLASLTQNPKRLKRILSQYPRLIDVQLGGQSCVHANFRYVWVQVHTEVQVFSRQVQCLSDFGGICLREIIQFLCMRVRASGNSRAEQARTGCMESSLPGSSAKTTQSFKPLQPGFEGLGLDS